jgi:hypothetical protein
VAITEESRHRMYQRLEAVLGPDEAATLMEHLPPVGWADVATKRDLDALRLDLEHTSRTLELRLDAMIQREFRAQTYRLFAGVTALAGVMIAAIRI